MREIKFRAWGKNSKEFLHTEEGIFGLTLKNIQNIHDIDAWEFQQYTGLKDKNGKEIYEGDVLKGGEVIRRVEDGGDLGGYYGFYFNSMEPEIIGNIYENPELLTNR